MNNKCVKCGLVNRQEALNCLRCGLALGASRKTGLNPFENEPTKSFSGVRLGIMLCVAVVGCFMAYQFFKVDVPKPVVKMKEQKELEMRMMTTIPPDTITTPNFRQSASESYRRDRDQRDMMKQSFNYSRPSDMQYHPPYVPPGSFGPPGAGVPYHTR